MRENRWDFPLPGIAVLFTPKEFYDALEILDDYDALGALNHKEIYEQIDKAKAIQEQQIGAPAELKEILKEILKEYETKDETTDESAP